MLNYTPQVYEAIIAALIVVGLIQFAALRSKWKQAEKMKTATKNLALSSTQAVMGAMAGTLRAKAETRRITEAADTAIASAEILIDELTEQLEELRENQEHKNEPEAPTIRFPFGSPGPLAGGEDRLPLETLLGSIGRNGGRPTIDPLEALLGGLTGARARAPGSGTGVAPTIQAFKITPRGLVPVNGPEDFGLGPDVSTSNRPDPSHRAPNLADILAALATMPKPRRPADPFEAIFGKAGGSGLFKADIFGDPADAAKAYAHPRSETEACDTQRPQEPQKASHETTAFPPDQSPRAG